MMMLRNARGLLAATLLMVPAGAAAQAAPPAPPPSATEMARQLSNPVASLVSVPMQFNWDNGVGTTEALRLVMNFQPVVPMTVNDRWNLIGRFILPFVSQPTLAPALPASAGTGDIVMSAFLSPARPGALFWGVGPVAGLPTTTNPVLGNGKWSVGPTAVVLTQWGRFTAGALANHLWSFAAADNTDRSDVNQTYVQPFFSYTTANAVTLSVSAEASGNWAAADGVQWSIPVIGSISKVTRVGPFPFSLGAGVGIFAAGPDGGPEWKLRMTTTLILPRSR